jgi:hypothetical protein
MEYQLTVQAQDNGTPPLSSTTNVNILVTLASHDDLLTLRCSGDDDESAFASNERRKFASGSSNHHAKASQGRTVMRVRVKENSRPGTHVTTIRAVNSRSVSFDIEDNRNNIFWVDPTTGVILVVGKGKGLLDPESKPSHEIQVKATNSVRDDGPTLFCMRRNFATNFSDMSLLNALQPINLTSLHYL